MIAISAKEKRNNAQVSYKNSIFAFNKQMTLIQTAIKNSAIIYRAQNEAYINE